MYVSQDTTPPSERSLEIETVIDRHLSQQTQLTTLGSLAGPGPELNSRTHVPGVILWDKVLYNRSSTASISSINSERQVRGLSAAIAYHTLFLVCLLSVGGLL